MMKNIPEPGTGRIVIVGAGFAGLKLARKLLSTPFQVVLIDRNNYHQFQPLYYQVATAGLEPSAVSFPIRKLFQDHKNFHFRIAALERVVSEKNLIHTSEGHLAYDHLVIAIGAETNYYGLKNVRDNALTMKSVSDALHIRNKILQNYEEALNKTDPEEIAALLNMVIVGGGATGVELAGALAEMKKFILPKDYPELDFSRMKIYLFEGADRLLLGMSEKASRDAFRYLEKMGVIIKLSSFVKDYDGKNILGSDAFRVTSKNVIWAAGIIGKKIEGLSENAYGEGQRLLTNSFHQVSGHENIYAIGDIALMKTDRFPDGHPQVAQAAIQQAQHLAKNLKKQAKGRAFKPFEYKDKGSLATVGRHLAVADLPNMRISGYLAWVLWSFVHLFAIIGARNRILVFMNWVINYFTYDQSLRLLIRHKS